ncbi:MAG: efflux RND transporter periplasmic adaptor subunit [Vicinamibacterales bacterium]
MPILTRRVLRYAFYAVVTALAAATAILVIRLPRAVTVPVARIEVGPVEATLRSEVPGLVMARQVHSLRAGRAGSVAELLVQPGARVTQGTPLLVLSNRDALASVRFRQHLLAEATRDVVEDCAGARLAARRVASARAASATGGGSADDIRIAVAAQDVANGLCEGAIAGRAWAVTALKAATETLQESRVRAPWDGVVLRILVSEGQHIASAGPLVDLARSDSLYVAAPFSLPAATALVHGEAVELVRLDGEHFAGTVAAVTQDADGDEGYADAWTVDITIAPGAQDRLAPGDVVDVAVTARRASVIRVPLAAITGRGEVWVVRNGRVTPTAVQIGLADAAGFAEVVDGLRAGDIVVLAPDTQALAYGTRVKPVFLSAP